MNDERNRGGTGDGDPIARLLHDPEKSSLGAELLVGRYELVCLRTAIRWTGDVDTARDIANDVLAEFIERETDPVRASFDESRSIEGYLVAMVHNRARDHFRRRQREEAHIAAGVSPDDLLSSISSDEILALDRVILAEQRAIVQACLAKLPTEEWRVLMMRYGEDPPRKLESIAEELGLVVSTVNYRINKALRHLRQLLEESGVRGVFHAGHE